MNNGEYKFSCTCGVEHTHSYDALCVYDILDTCSCGKKYIIVNNGWDDDDEEEPNITHSVVSGSDVDRISKMAGILVCSTV